MQWILGGAPLQKGDFNKVALRLWLNMYFSVGTFLSLSLLRPFGASFCLIAFG